MNVNLVVRVNKKTINYDPLVLLFSTIRRKMITIIDQEKGRKVATGGRQRKFILKVEVSVQIRLLHVLPLNSLK